MRAEVAACGWLLTLNLACAAAVPLATLQPEEVRFRHQQRDATPVTVTNSLRDRAFTSGLRFLANSEISYAIPAEQSSFSAVLVYAAMNGQPAKESSANRLRVRLLLDGKQIADFAMDDNTPPLEFAIPTAGARRLTIASNEEYGWENFALMDAGFRDQLSEKRSIHLPGSGEGYVNALPVPRQRLFHVFRPGEIVPVTAAFGGSAAKADVTIRLTPEQSHPIPAAAISIAMTEDGDKISRGTGTWTTPQWRGPAMLEIEQRVNGKIVFHERVRIAIAPEVPLAEISDSTFAVHTSSSGLRRLPDDFASLWGAKWNRAFLRWEVVEATPGHYDFSGADAIIDSLRNQNMHVLGVLGETSPGWAKAQSPEYEPAWRKFVQASIRHYKGRIDHWDVFNEVDVKYEYTGKKSASDLDVRLLRSAMEIIHAEDPDLKTVCCSTGTTPWLLYDKQLFATGLLPLIDIVSLHPYEIAAPEEKDGIFDYAGRLDALADLIRASGSSKPLWATESNWILGTRGQVYVTAPDIDEHTQAQYIVRANLISWARSVPYFLHSPFYHSHKRELHLDSLAAYANMASLFSSATNPHSLVKSPRVFGFSGRTQAGAVGALWTVSGTATVELSGIAGARFLDFYGNPISKTGASLELSTSPTYFVAALTSSPEIKILEASPSPSWIDLPEVESWSRTKGSSFENVHGGMKVTSQPSKYAYQLRSPAMSVAANTCYVARLQLSVEQGSLMYFATSTRTDKRVGDSVYISYIPDGHPREAMVRFITNGEDSVQLILADANLAPAVSRFEVLDRVQMARCP